MAHRKAAALVLAVGSVVGTVVLRRQRRLHQTHVGGSHIEPTHQTRCGRLHKRLRQRVQILRPLVQPDKVRRHVLRRLEGLGDPRQSLSHIGKIA